MIRQPATERTSPNGLEGHPIALRLLPPELRRESLLGEMRTQPAYHGKTTGDGFGGIGGMDGGRHGVAGYFNVEN